MSSSTTQVFVPCMVQPGDGELARTEDEEPHRQLAHSTPSSPEPSHTAPVCHFHRVHHQPSPAPIQPLITSISGGGADLGSSDSFT